MGKDYKFKVERTKFTIENMDKMERDGKLILQAYYQRASIWSPKQKYPLIDSALRKYPIPPIVVAKRKEGKSTYYRCIDGQQRCRTLIDYFRGKGFGKNTKFKIKQELRSSITIDDSHINRTYKELPTGKKNRYKNYPINFIVVVTQEAEFEEELYQRLNSNVEKVNDQELRYAKYHGILREEIIKISNKYQNFILDNNILKIDAIQRKQDSEKIWNKLFLIGLKGRVVDIKRPEVDLMYEKGRNQPKVKEITNKIHLAMDTLQMIFPEKGGVDRKFRNFATPSIFTAPNDFLMLVYAIFMMQQKMFDDKKRDYRKKQWRFPKLNSDLREIQERLEDFSHNNIGLRTKKKDKKGKIKKPDVITKRDETLVREYNRIYNDKHFGQQDNDLAKADIFRELMAKWCKDVSASGKAGRDERVQVWISALSMSRDRKVRCGKCGDVIQAFEEMDTGHRKKRIDGGPKILENLQPEHGKVLGMISCNRSDNQKSDF